jgi:hypothetical protein
MLARQLCPDQLRVAVRKAGSRQPTFVDERERRAADIGATLLPGVGDGADLLVIEVGKEADVIRRVDDDLLSLEGRVEVWDDPDAPGVANPQGLGRSTVLAAGTEGTRLELGVRGRLDFRQPSTRPIPAPGREQDAPTGERVVMERRQLRCTTRRSPRP